MRMYDIIKKKRDGEALSEPEIRYFIEGYTKGEIPDYQAAAFCMAVYFRGMTDEETAALTFAIRDSGERLDMTGIRGIRVDKHSTGGVGDKTSLVVAPIVASLGITVAKISGRGLGHTGGTVDKLESVPGFRTSIPNGEFIDIVNRTGIAIVGQSADIAPADKLLYALRDVTATVDSMPLIVSSIMSKKLAADDDCIVLDVKTGSGSFMKTVADSTRLAELMVSIGKRAGKKMLALITDMDIPLGFCIGNSLEVAEAVATLRGEGPADLTELCVILASRMLSLAGKGTAKECEALARKAIADGSALDKLAEMVRAQGGDDRYIYDTSLFGKAEHEYPVISEKSGYIASVDTEGYGTAALMLGAGRNRKDDVIDSRAGIILTKKTGDYVNAGDTLAVLYASDSLRFGQAAERFLSSTRFDDTAPVKRPLVLGEIG